MKNLAGITFLFKYLHFINIEKDKINNKFFFFFNIIK